MTVLRSSKFLLRPLRASDQVSLAQHAHDPEIHRNTLSVPFPYTLRHARLFISRQRKSKKSKLPQSVIFGIEVHGKIVGCIGLHRIIPNHKAEVGYWLGRQYWGQGITTRAVKLVVQYGFRELKLRRIFAFTYLWNTASQRVLVKAGFRHEGTLRKNVVKDGRAYDDHIFSIVR